VRWWMVAAVAAVAQGAAIQPGRVIWAHGVEPDDYAVVAAGERVTTYMDAALPWSGIFSVCPSCPLYAERLAVRAVGQDHAVGAAVTLEVLTLDGEKVASFFGDLFLSRMSWNDGISHQIAISSFNAMYDITDPVALLADRFRIDFTPSVEMGIYHISAGLQAPSVHAGTGAAPAAGPSELPVTPTPEPATWIAGVSVVALLLKRVTAPGGAAKLR
jgi:hypothetical protein